MLKLKVPVCISLLLYMLPAYSERSREEFCQKLPEGNVCSHVEKTTWGEAPKNSVDTTAGVAITLSNGEKKVWENRGKQSWGTDHVYQYFGFVPRSQFFLIKGIHWGEEVEYFLVSHKTGSEQKLLGLPHFAPDGKHFLVIPEHFGALPNNGNIYRISEQGLEEAGTFDFSSFLGVKPLWINQNVLAIFEVRFSSRKDYSIERVLVRVTNEKGTWVSREEKGK